MASDRPGAPDIHNAPGQQKSNERRKVEWENEWQDGNDFWDCGKPHPAVALALSSRSFLQPKPQSGASGRRPRLFYPGCGSGYELVEFAIAGYDAYGLDISPTAITLAKQRVALAVQQAEEEGRTLIGKIVMFAGDFFSDDWLWNVSDWSGDEGFDLIFDYRFFIAIDPDMRNRWSKRVAELMARPPRGVSGEGGYLMCMEWPHTSMNPLRPGWPPYRIDEKTHERHFNQSDAEHLYGASGEFIETRNAEPGQGDLGVVLIERFEEVNVGLGPDPVSLWKFGPQA